MNHFMSKTKVAIHIYHFPNAMVAAFDQHGDQMPELQRASPCTPAELDKHLERWKAAGLLADDVEINRGT